MKKTKSIYRERINRVIEYVNSHLHESTSLETLADVACFSSFHFHKIFLAVTGETVNSFTTRLRLEKAARLLRFSKSSVTEIALNCGFSSPSTLSRSFKDHFGISPSGYRSGGIKNDKIRKELFSMNDYILPMSDEELANTFPVTIKTFPERRVAYIRVTDAYSEGVVLNAFERMIRWAKENNLYESGTIFGMSLDDPMVTPKELYRYEVCLTVPESFELKSDSDISLMTMPEYRYATTRVSGEIKMVGTAISYLFNNWLINSNYEPEHQHALEIFLDKERVCDWSSFDEEICIPIKKRKSIN